nr:reverse transcriptase [Tanacetum cinerariifolium]
MPRGIVRQGHMGRLGERLVLFLCSAGSRATLKVLNLRELCRAHRPDVVFLMETKNKERYLESLRGSLPFTGFFYVNPIGGSGGLALWWKDSITLNIVNGNKNIILVDGICLAPPVSWRACFIYGPHDRRDRKLLWQQLSHLALSATCPFFVIGDFNLIGNVADKHGESGCEETVHKAWSDSSSSNAIVNLEQNLAHCAKDLNSWSRKHFGNNRKVIKELTNELRFVQSPHLWATASNNARQRLLLKKLEETWRKEELVWHQRSRVNRIKFGDQNTRFFFTCQRYTGANEMQLLC